jgi:hypothetical protein
MPSDLGYRSFFEEREYGGGLFKIVILLMCQESELNLKRRIRLSKKDKILYMDIMLDLPTMKSADMLTRQRIVAEKLMTEVPEVINKYKFPDFDAPRFISDLKEWINATGWLYRGRIGESEKSAGTSHAR